MTCALTRLRPGVFFTILMTGALATAGNAHADFARPLSSGVAYPTLADAVYRNPSLLMDEKGTTAGRLQYDPQGGYSIGFGQASSSSGWGLALNSLSAGTLTLGAGMGGQLYHLGANLSLANSINPGNATFALGGAIGGEDGFRLGATMSAIVGPGTHSLTVGLGYGRAQKYHVELDIKAPMSSLTGPGLIYIQTLTAVRYFDSFGLGILESSAAGISPLAVSSPDLGGMLQFYLAAKTSLDVKYTLGAAGGLGFGVFGRF